MLLHWGTWHLFSAQFYFFLEWLVNKASWKRCDWQNVPWEWFPWLDRNVCEGGYQCDRNNGVRTWNIVLCCWNDTQPVHSWVSNRSQSLEDILPRLHEKCWYTWWHTGVLCSGSVMFTWKALIVFAFALLVESVFGIL